MRCRLRIERPRSGAVSGLCSGIAGGDLNDGIVDGLVDVFLMNHTMTFLVHIPGRGPLSGRGYRSTRLNPDRPVITDDAVFLSRTHFLMSLTTCVQGVCDPNEEENGWPWLGLTASLDVAARSGPIRYQHKPHF